MLFVRTVGHPLRASAGIQNIVEDQSGECDRVLVYNESETATPEQVLPKDCVFAIKEPFYKIEADGGYSVHIDHPSDIVQLHVTDALFPRKFLPPVTAPDTSVLMCKASGNAALKEKDYILARQLYTQGLQLSESIDEVAQDLLRNRALVNHYLGRYEEAEDDARASIIEPRETMDSRKKSLNNKALYRAGRALYGLRKFQEADAAFLSILKVTPGDKDATREHNTCVLRLHEELSGRYDFEHMSNSAAKMSRLDHADFTSNTAVRTTSSRGRGLFACKDIKAGGLVLCEKAFHAVFESEHNLYTVTNINTGTTQMGAEAGLTVGTIQKLRCNPKAASRFLDLYDDGYQPKCPPTLIDNTTVVDSFQVQATIEHTAFACPDAPSSDVYHERQTDTSNPCGSVGVWITSAYINHQCVGNVYRSFMGDMMIIRAVRDIARDEEISIPYRDVDFSNEDSGKLLKRLWGFECDCIICVAESKTPAAQRTRRFKLVGEVNAFLSAHQLTGHSQPTKDAIKRAKQLYKDLEKAYDGTHYENVPRMGLVTLGVWLCQIHSQASDYVQSLNAANAVLGHVGFHVKVNRGDLIVKRTNAHFNLHPVDAAMHAAAVYDQRGQSGVAKQYVDLARNMYLTLFGELRGFVKRYPKHAR